MHLCSMQTGASRTRRCQAGPAHTATPCAYSSAQHSSAQHAHLRGSVGRVPETLSAAQRARSGVPCLGPCHLRRPGQALRMDAARAGLRVRPARHSAHRPSIPAPTPALANAHTHRLSKQTATSLCMGAYAAHARMRVRMYACTARTSSCKMQVHISAYAALPAQLVCRAPHICANPCTGTCACTCTCTRARKLCVCVSSSAPSRPSRPQQPPPSYLAACADAAPWGAVHSVP